MAISAAELGRQGQPTERVGILGGTFDPVHVGHLQVAQQFRAHLGLDRVLLVPCGVPVHRAPPQGSNEQRCRMLELACQDEPWLEVDRREVDSPDPSWTHATLSSLRQELPSSALYFLMGADAFLGLPTWKRWEELPSLAHLIVSTRPGYQLDVESLSEPLASFCQRHLVERREELRARLAGHVYLAELQTAPVSSSEVRARIKQCEALGDFLSPAVAAYIVEQQLYL